MAKDKEPVKVAETQAATEPVYDAAEIAANAEALFGCHPDIATAALKCAGIEHCELAKAKSIIRAFAERKVR